MDRFQVTILHLGKDHLRTHVSFGEGFRKKKQMLNVWHIYLHLA